MPQTIKTDKIKEFIARSCELNEIKRMSREELMEFELIPKNSVDGQGTEK